MQRSIFLHSKYLDSRYLLVAFVAGLFLSASHVYAQDITSGLVGHWKFDEGSGTTAGDSSGNNNTGTLTNGPTWTAGKIGGALLLNGTTQYINVLHNNLFNFNTGDFSVSLWANPAALGGGALIGKYGTTGNGWRMYTSSSGRLIFDANGGERFSNGGVVANQWQLFSIVKTASGIKLYVNGIDQTNYGPAPASTDNTAPLTIGTVAKPPIGDCCQRYAKAIVDDVRIYNRAIAASDIQALYNLGSGAPPPSDTTPPTVSITAPASGSTVSGSSVNISANASDPSSPSGQVTSGIAGVQFKLDGSNLGTEDTTSPYSTTWNTTAISNGSHTLTATARDAAGNQTTSSGVTITVNNVAPPADTQAPATPTNLSASAQSSSQINLSWTASTDNMGVTGYRIERCQGAGCTNFTQIAAPTGASYSDTGLSANTTYRYQVRAVDAAGNLSGYSSIASAMTQSVPTGGTALATLAASLQPGTYAELNTGLTSAFLETKTANTAIFQFSDSASWDPISKKLLFVGQPHYNPAKFIIYNSITNTWGTGPLPLPCMALDPSTDPSGCPGHAFDHNTVDPATGDIYYRSYSSVNIYRYSVVSNTWTALLAVPSSVLSNHQVAGALAYFPEMGGLIFVDAWGISFWNKSSNQWSSLGALPAIGQYSNFAQYDPVDKIVFFGGGNGTAGSQNVFKISSTGAVSQVASAPVVLGVASTLTTVDPVSGHLLAFDVNNQMYEYALATNTWTQKTSPIPWLFISSSQTAIQTPVPELGVILFIRYNSSSVPPNVFVYKHAAGGGTPTPTPSPSPTPGGVNPTLAALGDNASIDLSVLTCTTPVGDTSYDCQDKLSYSNWVYDPNSHKVVTFGGGHASTFTDAVSIFDFSTLTWSEPYPPTPCSAFTYSNLDSNRAAWLSGPAGPYPRPVSRHTYDLAVIVPGINDYVLMAQANGGTTCTQVANEDLFLTGVITHYHLATNMWEFTTAPTDGKPESGSNLMYGAAEYDPISQQVIIMGQTGLFIYDPVAKTKTRVIRGDYGEWKDVNSNPMTDDIGYDNALVYYPPNGYFYWFRRGNPVTVYELRPNRNNWNASTLTRLTTSGPTSSQTDPSPGYAYDSVNQVIGGGTENGNFHIFNPVTRVWTRLTPNGPNMGLMHNKAAAYDPINNVFLVKSSTNTGGHVFAYRYKNGSPPLPTDTQAPTNPTNLIASVASSSQINLSWTASTDNIGVAGYRVERCPGASCTNFVQITTPTGTSYSDIGLSANTTYRYQVRAIDAAGNISGYSSVVSATTQATTPPPGGSDFTTRCSAPGVVRCYGFDDPNDFTNTPSDQTKSLHLLGASGGGPNRFTWDSAMKASGNYSMRVDSPAQANADCCGSVFINIANNYTVQFGAGETFYMQERQRYSSGFMGQWFQTGGGGTTGAKLMWIGEGDQPGITTNSCTEMEGVLTTDTSHPILGGQYGFPSFYHGCGRFIGLDWYDGTQVRMQRQGPPYCYYPNDPQRGCFPLYANEWMTFKYRIQIGTWNTKSSRVQVWAAREGQPSVMIFDSNDAFPPTAGNPGGFTLYNMVDCAYTGGAQPCAGGSGTYPNAKFGKAWFSPYMTGRAMDQTTVGGTNRAFSIWYDELIISTQDIADPGTTPPPTPLLGDLNGDRTVNNFDWNIMAGVWFTADPVADINNDTIVNTADFYYIYTNWNVTN